MSEQEPTPEFPRDELTEKRELLFQLKRIQENPGWKLYQEYLDSQINFRRQEVFKAPSPEFTDSMRTFLAGEIQALHFAKGFFEAIIIATQEEVADLELKEKQDARSSDTSDRDPELDASDPGGQPSNLI